MVRFFPLAILFLVLTAASGIALEDKPLAGLDTSSPRATYQSFLAEMKDLEELYTSYRRDKSAKAAEAVLDAVQRGNQAFDLSEVPPATRSEVGTTAHALLYDILLRLPPVDPATIPGGDKDLPAAWRIPDTEIVIAKAKGEDGEERYLFSPNTVKRLQAFHERIIDRPPQQSSPYDNWVEETIGWTGPFFSYQLLRTIPGSLQETLLGTPIWKVALTSVIWAAMFLLLLLWSVIVRRIAYQAKPAWRLLWFLTVPALLAALVSQVHVFIAFQVNPSGAFAKVEAVASSIALYGAGAWAVWIAAFLLVEAIIASPAIPEGSYDANLLRLVARVTSLAGAGAVVVYGASDLGVPALGLLTGLGVGGFALALAAQTTIENLFGGVSIFADRPFRIGDFIHYGGSDGVVEMIGPRSSRLRGIDGTLTTVPNADLAKMHIINYSLRNKCVFVHTLGLRYETTPDQLEWLLSETRRRVGEHPKVEVSSGFPRVRVMGFGASSIDVEVRAYVITADWNEFLEVQEELILDLMRTVEAAGSGFAFPSRTLYLGRDAGLDAEAKQAAEFQGRRRHVRSEAAPARSSVKAAQGQPQTLPEDLPDDAPDEVSDEVPAGREQA
ncbi:MAG: mechanosensitive ion channel family protein [Kiloniellales bacterium]